MTAKKTQVAAAVETYGGNIEEFYSKASLLRLKTHSLVLPHHELPWKYVDEVRQSHGLPVVMASSPRAIEANEIIAVLNSTEDFLVFKIAMNKLLEIVRGTSAGPFYRGDEYAPEKLAQAITESDQ